MRRNELKHYGVQGMKWGEKKYNPYIVGVGNKSYGSTTTSKTKTSSIKPIEVQRLSNAGQNKINVSELDSKKMNDILEKIKNIYLMKTNAESARLESLGKRYMGFSSLTHNTN